MIDSDGYLWVGTGSIEIQGSGLSRLNFNEEKNTWELTNFGYRSGRATTTPRTSAFLNDHTILSIYEDRGNNLWFGSFQAGLNKMNKRRIKFRSCAHEPDNPNSLSSDSVLCTAEDAEGILWIGTYSGLNRFDRKNHRFTHYKHDPNDPTSIGSDSIWALYCERPDTIWVGTGNKGIHRFNPETETSTPFNTGIGSITHIAEDNSGSLWIGTWGNGVAQLDRETGELHHYSIAPGSPNRKESVIYIYEDKNKVLWFCTYGHGLVKVTKPAKSMKSAAPGFQAFRHKEGDNTSISSDYLQSMAETDPGDMWIGSDYGLNRFDRETNTFTCFTEADGLCNNTIYGIVVDGEDLWLSTNGGISQFNTRTLTFRNYDTGDGLQAMEFNQGAFSKTRGGEILFGGVNGLNVFFPGHVPTNPHVPPVVITRFTVFDHPVTLPGAVYAADRVQLSYKDRFFALEFAALDFERPGRNRYAYKLEGFNNDWVQCGSRRYVSFSNLAGGNYIFRVKGSNNDGAWNEQGAAIRISITPPTWQTWWFRVLAVVLVIGFIYLLFRFRIRHLKNRMEKEHLENELKLKTDFTAMLVHDLRNPLQCIIGYSDLVADETEPAGIRQFSSRIKMSSSTMLNLINDMLDISKFEAGKMVIHPERTNLVDILNENLQLIEPLLERNKNRFDLHLEQLPPVMADAVRISQVINNLLANAVKFSPEGGVIAVTAGTVREHERQFQEITVTDQGPGIAPEKQAFIFSRYAQVENISEAAAKGTGLGLAVSHLIIEAHQGTIGYRPAAPGGSVFFFRIPGD
jgi:signal transduction histidine kinase/streptogramin lyase